MKWFTHWLCYHGFHEYDWYPANDMYCIRCGALNRYYES